MRFFEKKIGVVFLKESSEAELFIEKMQNLLGKAPQELKTEIEKQIKIARYGVYGENNIAFELKNSGMDMYVLHDINLEIEDLCAQIDYLVVTRKNIYIIECKNLIGDIEIDQFGNFVRNYQLGNKKIREGFYSPITQNERHLRVIKEIRKKTKSNIFTKAFFEKNFENTYKSLIVLANPKSCLHMRYAKKEIKEKVIKIDQMIAKIKEIDLASKDGRMSDAEMEALAKFYLNENKQVKTDYAQKYEEMLKKFEDSNVEEIKEEESQEITVKYKNQETLAAELKKFRLEISRLEGIKPYYIFTDAQMYDLIEKRPKTKEELLKITGFGEKKVEKYGESILMILEKTE